MQTSEADSKDSWLDATVDDSWLDATTDTERRTLPASGMTITVDDVTSVAESAPRRFAQPIVPSDVSKAWRE